MRHTFSCEAPAILLRIRKSALDKNKLLSFFSFDLESSANYSTFAHHQNTIEHDPYKSKSL